MERKSFLKALGLGAVTVAVPISVQKKRNKRLYGKSLKWYQKHGHLNPNRNKQVERNLEGKFLERKKSVNKAIELYEQNVKEEVWLVHPYKRLFVLYKKEKNYQKAKEVATKYIKLHEEWEQLREDNNYYTGQLTWFGLMKDYFVQGIQTI